MASDDIWILGINMTKFGKHPDLDIVDLAAEAALAALADGGVTMNDMGVLAAGNLMGRAAASASSCRSRSARPASPSTTSPTPAPPAPPRCARRSWRSRPARPTTASPSASRSWPAPACSAAGGTPKSDKNVFEPKGRYGAVAPVDGRIGTDTMPGVFAQIGMEYGHKYGGTSFELFAKISEKNHAHSTLNPLAAYQKQMTLEEIMGDMMIAYPNTRPMCSANCDGAAAAVVVIGREAQDAVARAAAPGREGVGVGPHHRPVAGELPGPARRQHAHQERGQAGLRAGRRRPGRPRPRRAARLLRHRRARPLRQPQALRGGRRRRLLRLRAPRGATARRRSTSPAASSPRATRSPPPASPTSGRSATTSAARPATVRSRAPRSAWPTSSASARPAACTSSRSPRPSRGGTRAVRSTGGVNHLALVCRDMARTVDFYTNVLGMPLDQDDRAARRHAASTSSSTAATATRWPSSGSPTRRSRSPGVSAPAVRPDQGELTQRHRVDEPRRLRRGAGAHRGVPRAADRRRRALQRGLPTTTTASGASARSVHRRRVRPVGVLPGPRRDPARARLLDLRQPDRRGRRDRPRAEARPHAGRPNAR